MKKLVKEFKEFINKGDLVTIAVAFVLALAFKAVIDAITGTKDSPGIIGGILGAIFGGDQPDFSARGITINGSFIPLGALVTEIINFLLVAAVLFLVVKAYNKMRREQPTGPTEVELLTEIRDSLRNR
jgi:large conductance mechanosensitive channel